VWSGRQPRVSEGDGTVRRGSSRGETFAPRLVPMPVLVSLLLAVTLGSPFGTAEARALEADGGMTIEVSVEVDGGRTAVLARTVSFAGELQPVALIDQGDGRWRGVLVFSGREDVQVAFEAIDADGSSDISALSTLTELGVDPAVIVPSLPTRPAPAEPGPNWWLLGGIGAGLAALILFIVWWAGSARDTSPGDAETPERDSEDPDESTPGSAPVG